ncbi:PREDICTED: uncharacterized protein LOC109130093 [Camelina sativa]|uniref:Uncharacterized protein LOC109130093 n=1 Tax=Camelina sativa TaxID=90675 RepID=A0ABM1R768_CAMSA|nr:PREDICTED: uncharacterized protein LOC109130093 [Camelina sativa]
MRDLEEVCEIRNRNFWDLNPANAGSWIWRKLCRLRPLVRPFIVCKIGSGERASFWYDNWTGLGPLLDIASSNAPQVVGLPLQAVVRDAGRGQDWWLTTSRSRNPIIILLKNALPPVGDMLHCEHEDTYLWKPDQNPPSHMFSMAKTWSALNPQGPQVPWYKSVWFKHRVPKHAFICWVVAWNRLHTRDRLRSWGLNVPVLCTLCNAHPETRNHLFFQCDFANEIWRFFTNKMGLQAPSQFIHCLQWVHTVSSNPNLVTILKLAFQASIYMIWKERNQRIHSSSSKTASVIIREIKTIIRSRLLPLSSAPYSQSPGQTLLITWFSLFL